MHTSTSFKSTLCHLLPVSLSQFKGKLYEMIHSCIFLIIKNDQLLIVIMYVSPSQNRIFGRHISTGQVCNKRRRCTAAWTCSARICYIDISVEMITKYFIDKVPNLFVFVIYIFLKSSAVPSGLIPISCFDFIESLD